MSDNPTISLRIIDGTDKGKEFNDLPLPVSLGREAQNTIRLHDEKVSRYHCKIQEDGGEIILTDIESTNGTLLNGQPIHIALIHAGDLIAVGQSLIIVGKRKEIVRRLAVLDDLQIEDAALRLLVAEDSPEFLPINLINEMENYSYDIQDALKRLHSIAPPELPSSLSAAQTARLADLLAYVQLRMKMILEKARTSKTTNRVSLNPREWQSFLDLFSRLTDYYKRLTQPEN
ncbi:MAG: FHA domain-containing protein [Thermoguttaceae bacterium]|nr:FHA domain-containing protein [Thermoguttaceae bacterium]MDO4858458.1 FHA domain-containing protein [Thermoguttaceae bacterium]